ncbi:hypothetical protein BH11BAC5_BH11BAC5_48640 [soil metagenome]
MITKNLQQINVIIGPEGSDKLSYALDIVKRWKHQTAFLDMFMPGMLDGIIPSYQIHKSLKAVVISNVHFPLHLEAIKKMCALDRIPFKKLGTNKNCFLKKPVYIILTTSSLETIPVIAFASKIGILKTENPQIL